MKILLVEDNPGDALLLRENLRDVAGIDYALVCVERVQHAVEYIAVEPVDVILLDLSLPDGYGLQTVERIHAAAPALPIVVLTGQDDHQLALQAVQAGAQDYIAKSKADGETLVRAMRYAIQRAQVLQELRAARAELEVRVQERTAELAHANAELRAEIAERKQAEAALQQAKFEVEEASRVKSEFLSRMSHELRTPLNAILGFGQVLEMDNKLSNPQRQHLEHILQAGRHMLKLVDYLLQITHVDKPETLLVPADFAELLKAASGSDGAAADGAAADGSEPKPLEPNFQ